MDSMQMISNDAMSTQIEGGLAKALAGKESGTQHFRAGDLNAAKRDYLMARLETKSLLDNIKYTKSGPAAVGPSHPRQKEVADVHELLCSNLAAVFLKLERWDRVVAFATEPFGIRPWS
jgi:hypothetical protein